jgi:hypothetical protein
MSKQSIYQRLVALPSLAFEDNKKQKGLYLLGIESKKLVYGFSARNNPDEARAELESRGYSGEILGNQVYTRRKNSIPSVWKVDKDITKLIDAETLKLAEKVLGSRELAENWFKCKPMCFNGKTPYEVYKSNPKDVSDTLYRIAHGVIQ